MLFRDVTLQGGEFQALPPVKAQEKVGKTVAEDADAVEKDDLHFTAFFRLMILKLASPFDPFPRELAQSQDSLRFSKEFQFLGGKLVSTPVQVPAE